MDTQRQFCPNPDCPARGEGRVRQIGHPQGSAVGRSQAVNIQSAGLSPSQNFVHQMICRFPHLGWEIMPAVGIMDGDTFTCVKEGVNRQRCRHAIADPCHIKEGLPPKPTGSSLPICVV